MDTDTVVKDDVAASTITEGVARNLDTIPPAMTANVGPSARNQVKVTVSLPQPRPLLVLVP
jgi:hypothetical protein